METDLVRMMTRGAAAIQIGLAATWIAMGWVLAHVDHYGMLGAGTMQMGWAILAALVFALSILTIVAAVHSVRGSVNARRWSLVSMAAAAVWSLPRIRSPWPGSRSPWSGAHPPQWFAVLSQGTVTFVGAVAVLALLAAATVLRRGAARQPSAS